MWQSHGLPCLYLCSLVLQAFLYCKLEMHCLAVGEENRTECFGYHLKPIRIFQKNLPAVCEYRKKGEVRVKLQKTKMNDVQATWLTPMDPLRKGGRGREEEGNRKEREGEEKDRQTGRQRQREYY